jgi:hypothetical protein
MPPASPAAMRPAPDTERARHRARRRSTTAPRRVALAVAAVCTLAFAACSNDAGGSGAAPGAGEAGDLVKNTTRSTPVRATYVVAGMGDSFGSGEGNPAQHGSGNWAATAWYSLERPVMSEICHRSSASGFYKAVRRLETQFPNIDFVRKNFACSGAIVQDLLDVRQVPGNLQFVASGLPDVGATQLEQLREWVREQVPTGRPLDALYLSIGGNNAGFADALATCMLRRQVRNCWQDDSVRESAAVVDTTVGDSELELLYAELDQRLDRTVRPRQVVISEYPNFVQRAGGSWCETTLIAPKEFEGLWQTIGEPLNNRIQETTRLGWDVAEMESRFIGHGICEGDARRWMNTGADAAGRQGRDMDTPIDVDGTAIDRVLDGVTPEELEEAAIVSTGMYHPNDRGYEAYADAIESRLKDQLVARLTPDAGPTIRVSATTIAPTSNTVPGRRVAGAPWWMVQVTMPTGGTGVDAVASMRVTVTLPDGSTVTDTSLPATQSTFFVRMPLNTGLTVAACGFQHGPAPSDVFCARDTAFFRTPLSGSTSTVAVPTSVGTGAPTSRVTSVPIVVSTTAAPRRGG